MTPQTYCYTDYICIPQDCKVVMGSGSFSDVVPANLRLASKANMRASMVNQHLAWSEPSSTHVAKLMRPAADVRATANATTTA
jgi:hypothetical protein